MYAKLREYGQAPVQAGNQYRCEKCGKPTTFLQSFQQCPNCGRWVCGDDWDRNLGTCTLCSSGVTAKVAEVDRLKGEVEELRKLLAAKDEELAKGKSKPVPPLGPSLAKPIVGPRAYVSYAVGSDVEKLVERKVRRLLETLGMSVITSKREPGVAHDLPAAVKSSDLVLAMLTKDIRREEDGKVTWEPTHYVIEDVKAAAGKRVILMAEPGVEYPTEILPGASVIEFRKDDPAELIVDLAAVLRRLELRQTA